MNKKKVSKGMRDAVKKISLLAGRIREEHMFAKYQKVMGIFDRQMHYAMCKKMEGELINSIKEFGACVEEITQELNSTYDHLTILTKKQAKIYTDEMEEAQKMAEEGREQDAARKELLDNHGFRGPTGQRLVEEGKIVTYKGKGSVKKRNIITPNDRRFYE